ncbi:hypothetical protein TSAR_005466, partial [Trichomalopsis sarcophagae]
HDRHGSEWIIPRNTYSSNKVKCFVPENVTGYGYQLAYSTIAEIFSVRIASEAMQNDGEDLSLNELYREYVKVKIIIVLRSQLHTQILMNFHCSRHSAMQKAE